MWFFAAIGFLIHSEKSRVNISSYRVKISKNSYIKLLFDNDSLFHVKRSLVAVGKLTRILKI
jgi:hypothetical protein